MYFSASPYFPVLGTLLQRSPHLCVYILSAPVLVYVCTGRSRRYYSLFVLRFPFGNSLLFYYSLSFRENAVFCASSNAYILRFEMGFRFILSIIFMLRSFFFIFWNLLRKVNSNFWSSNRSGFLFNVLDTRQNIQDIVGLYTGKSQKIFKGSMF